MKTNRKSIVTVLTTCVLTIITIFLAITNNKSYLVAKKEVVIELGNTIPTDVKYYLDMDKINSYDLGIKDKILKETKISISNTQNIKEYPPVGNYTVKLIYGNEEKEVNVIVKDTTSPLFDNNSAKELSFIKDCKPDIEELIKVFNAKDLSKVTITINDEDVDYSKSGEYRIIITATDEFENKAEKEVALKVTDPIIDLDITSKSIYVKETFSLKATVKGKETKAKFSSSDNSIATVSDSGNVTAKKKGSTIITAEANGVKAICKVTVKDIPKNSTTATQTVVNPNTGKQEEVTVVKPQDENINTVQPSYKALELQNDKRESLSIGILKWNNELYELAKKRALEISKNFEHLPYPLRTESGILVRAENIAKGYSSATAVVNGWYNSSSHKESMLNSSYTKCAVARYGNYWVALFSK